LLAVPSGFLLASLAAPAPTAAIAAIAFIAAIGLSIDDAVWFTVFQQRIPEHAMSRISSFDWFGSVALNPVGYAVIGPLAEHLGVAATLACAAGVNSAIGLALLLVPAVRAIEDRPLAEPG
jgi:hypothetical protein